MHPHTTAGEGVTQRLTSSPAALEWESGGNMNLYGQKPNWRGLIHSSKLPVCAIIQHDKYELNQIHFCFVCLFFCLVLLFFCFCPTAPLISLFRMDRASHYFSVTHIVWILWISSAKPTVNVYVVCVLKSYICKCVCMFFSLYRVLILYIIDKCEFYRTRALFVRSHQVNSSTWFCLELIGQCGELQLSRGRAVGGPKSETKFVKKCQRLHSGREESFLDVLAASEAGM